MRSKYWILPYKTGSRSARALAQALGGKVIKRRNSRYRYRQQDVVINWGCSDGQSFPTINSPASVSVASDKTAAFMRLYDSGVSVPEFTITHDTAMLWAQDGPVVCRTLTRATSGRGIVLADTPDQMVSAPLYTKYVPKRQEFRVHVFDGQVIDVQRKARDTEVEDEDVNWRIRNHGNGFVFARGDVGDYRNERLDNLAIDTVRSLGLVFGAVDIIWNQHRDRYYVLEVNTAPGLEGSTIHNYVNAINQYVN